MYPILKSGDIVGFKGINNFSNVIYGEMYIVAFHLDGDQYLTVKYVNRSEKEGYVKLVSYNPHHEPMDLPVDTIQDMAIVKFSIRKKYDDDKTAQAKQAFSTDFLITFTPEICGKHYLCTLQTVSLHIASSKIIKSLYINGKEIQENHRHIGTAVCESAPSISAIWPVYMYRQTSMSAICD